MIDVKIWNQESTDWRFVMERGGDCAPLTLRAVGPDHALVVNLGQDATAETARRGAAKAVKAVRELGAQSLLLDVTGIKRALGAEGLAAAAQGAELACYRQESWKEQEDKPFTLYIAGAEDMDAEAVLQRTRAVTRAVCLARDMTNRPVNMLTPALMAVTMAEAAEKAGVEVDILRKKQTRALGMGAYHAVGDSAAHPPRLIVLRWKGGKKGDAPIALVGKGVCFDTGGYNIKTGPGLKVMRSDMAGAAAVCAVVLALAENKVPINVTAVIPAVENRISPESTVPGDVVRSMSGKTIQINNTDAEGRLILADAITYAIQEEKAGRVVDIATLTGACANTLGHLTAGLVSNSDELCGQLLSSAQKTGEQYWRFPTFPEYKKMIESPVADLSNQSNDGCGAITAGMFLMEFAGDTPWVHVDIAGTAWTDQARREYQTVGATGAGVTTLYQLCADLADN